MVVERRMDNSSFSNNSVKTYSAVLQKKFRYHFRRTISTRSSAVILLLKVSNLMGLGFFSSFYSPLVSFFYSNFVSIFCCFPLCINMCNSLFS